MLSVYDKYRLREGALQLGEARSLFEEQVGARLVTVRGAVGARYGVEPGGVLRRVARSVWVCSEACCKAC